MSTHKENLGRVRKKIHGVVLRFFVGRSVPYEFYMKDLTEYVVDHVPCAPDSPRRILRELKADGVVLVANISRSESKYVFHGLRLRKGKWWSPGHTSVTR